MTPEPGVIILPDGRQLAYAEYGTPDGFPIIGCHGTPGSRLLMRMADAPAIAEEPIDKFVQRFWRHKQAVFALHPSVVFQHPVGDVSDVGTRLKPPTSIANWAQRSRRKAGNALCRFRFNATFILASTYSGLRTRTEVARLAGPRTG